LYKEDGTIDEVAAHGEGELLIKGDTLFDRYLNKPEATAKEHTNGWFKTGDYV
jgi:long-subunit acyl-CoA synthetase (AMP-forming)